jgi:hypothetical protein
MCEITINKFMKCILKIFCKHFWKYSVNNFGNILLTILEIFC